MFCSRCGAEYGEGMSFCQKCGNDLRGNTSIPSQNIVHKPTKKKRKKRWLIAVIVVLLISGGAGIALWQLGIWTGWSDNITRGYNASTTAEEVWEKEKAKKDTKEGIGWICKETYNEQTDLYEYINEETEDPEEMSRLVYAGGKLFGMKAENIEFDFFHEGRLSEIRYIFSKEESDYYKVKQKVSEEFKEYRIVGKNGEYWSIENYHVSISDEEQNNEFRVRVFYFE